MHQHGRFSVYTLSLALVLTATAAARAQESDAPKVEVGVHFTSLTMRSPDFFGDEHRPGLGGRVTYNFTDYFAVEAEANHFPDLNSSPQTASTGGSIQQLQAGVKVGKRYNRFGLFAKARPGFVTFSRVNQLVGTETIDIGGFPFTVGRFEPQRKTYFSLDLGGVVEFYHSRRLFTRFDFGDTIIRYPERSQQSLFLPIPFVTAPAETQHNFQFAAGIGFRF